MSSPKPQLEQNVQPGRAIQGANERIVDAMNRWSGSFFKLLLPSNLGAKANIKSVADEGAKVLSMGAYMGRRTAVIDAIPHDGATYEGRSIADDTTETGSLWMWEASFPGGFSPTKGESFIISMGKISKCQQCRGHGKIRCQKCSGKVRWTERRGDKIVDYVCSCGDGKQLCPPCDGYGEMLQVLKVDTQYTFDEKKTKEYSGRLPESLLMGSSGRNIFRHVSEFEKRVVAEAIDGFEPDEFDRLMGDMHGELKSEISANVAGQMVNPALLHGLVDNYFKSLPNPVAANKRLREEILPVRMKCEVTDVPVQAVNYEYKGKDYSLYVYGNNADVWVDGDKPSEFTWKMGVLLGVLAAVAVVILIMSLGK